MADSSLFLDVEALAARIPDGALVAVPADYAGVPMALARALIRRGARDLRLVAVPATGIVADLLIGAGCVAEIETSGVSLGEFGPAPRFTKAVREGRIRIKDATCPAVHAELQAGEKGVPFMPLRGIIGSDLLRVRPDWKVIDNPYGEDDPIVLLPALRPDVAIFHAAMADREGNVWVGRRAELRTMAHAAKGSCITVERLYDGDLLEDDRYAAGTIPAMYVEAVAEAADGAWPCAFWYGERKADADHLRRYAEMARSDEGFARYLDEFVLCRRVAA